MKKDSNSSRHWAHKNGQNSWTMFKVISEFVEGFEKLNKIDPCVSVFGSARTKPGEKYYELAVEVGSKICQAGYGVITGGGPGIMEAGNKGAQQVMGSQLALISTCHLNRVPILISTPIRTSTIDISSFAK